MLKTLAIGLSALVTTAAPAMARACRVYRLSRNSLAIL